jgi:hypothetical protein
VFQIAREVTRNSREEVGHEPFRPDIIGISKMTPDAAGFIPEGAWYVEP